MSQKRDTALARPAGNVDVAVISWNTRELTLRCLRSLLDRSHLPPDKIWVVDSASRDGTLEAVEERFPGVARVALPENRGYAHACNVAAGKTADDHLLLLNADVEMLPGSLRTACEALESVSSRAAVGFHLVDGWGRWDYGWEGLPTAFSRVLPWRFDRWRERLQAESCLPGTRPQEVGWVGGGALLVKRSSWEDVGPMDEEYYMYAEETDWCWRAARRGWTVAGVPEAWAIHWGGKSASQRPGAMYAALYSSKMRILRMYRPGSEKWLKRLLLPQWIWTALKGLWSGDPASRLRGKAARGFLKGREGMELIEAVDEELTLPAPTPPDLWSLRDPWTVFVCHAPGSGRGDTGSRAALESLKSVLMPPQMALVEARDTDWRGCFEQGLGEGRGEWLLFIDSRLRLEKGAFLGLCHFPLGRENVGGMVPLPVDGEGCPVRPFAGRSEAWHKCLRRTMGQDHLFAVRKRLGLLPWFDPVPLDCFERPSCFALRRDALAALGGLDDFGGEDGLKRATRLMARLGWKLYGLPWIVARDPSQPPPSLT